MLERHCPVVLFSFFFFFFFLPFSLSLFFFLYSLFFLSYLYVRLLKTKTASFLVLTQCFVAWIDIQFFLPFEILLLSLSFFSGNGEIWESINKNAVQLRAVIKLTKNPRKILLMHNVLQGLCLMQQGVRFNSDTDMKKKKKTLFCFL